MDKEKTLWTGSPSQVLNLGAFILILIIAAAVVVVSILFLPLLLILLIVPLVMLIINYLKVKSEVFEVTTQRLRKTTGIFSKQTEDLELYRVRDYKILQPFFLRLFGLGTIELITIDKSSPHVLIPAVKNPKELIDIIRENVEKMKTAKGVRELDVE
ncbi:MAG TPA: PH domain-containing protein [Ignavibacteria bacterium]|nr:PH domain-containing protein [Ignavibacteria bacterium]